MSDPKSTIPLIFESADVTALVGVQSAQLNKFVERKLYGIAPSVRAETGRGGRRIFSEADVFGIAFVWWLIQSGLRSQTIQCVLDQANGNRRRSSANDSARALIESGAMILVIKRDWQNTRSRPVQQFDSLAEDRAVEFETRGCRNSVLLVPFGNLVARLKKEILKFRRT